MNMKEKHKLNAKITQLELVLNGITLIILIGSMIWLLLIWGTLPLKVPAHFNALGEVDRWGSKTEMIILPIITILLWVGITILERYLYRYYTNVTKNNVQGEYLNTRLMLNVIKNIITLIFSYIGWKNVQIALGNHHSLSPWFTPVSFILLFVPIGYFIIRSIRIQK